MTRPEPIQWKPGLTESEVQDYVRRMGEWEQWLAQQCEHYEGPAPRDRDAFPHTCKRCGQPHAWHSTCEFATCSYEEHA